MLYGLIITVPDSANQLKAPLEKIKVQATTCGSIAHNSIQFHYKNYNHTAVQSKFVFPANSESAIYHLEALIGSEKKIVGKVKEKCQAEKEFKEAVSSGKTAVMAKESQEASDIIELEIGAFAAGETAIVTIKEVYEMSLVKKGKSFLYKFPTSLFVRYGEGTVTAGSSDACGVPDYNLDFSLKDHSNIKKITPKPWLKKEIGVEFTEDGNFQFKNARKVFQKDHDIILDLELAENFRGYTMKEDLVDQSIIDPDDQKSGKSLTLSSIMITVPSIPLAELPAKEFVFVVDCSGSMDGTRIVEARKTLQQLINSLPVDSYFNIVRFGSSYEFLFKESKEYNKKNKEKALKLAETMAANLGGTEMFRCLKSVMEQEQQIKTFKRQVFVLTDGGIWNQDATLDLVKKNADKNRVFSFGIGSGVSTSLVNGLASQGKGVAAFITDSHSLKKSENLSEICVKSIMASASVNISGLEVFPSKGYLVPNLKEKMLVDSTCLNLFHENMTENVKLSMTVSDKDELQIVEECTAGDIVLENVFEANVLHKLAAKKKIKEIINSERMDLVEIKKLSIEQNVLCPFTALIGVADDKSVTGVSQRIDVGRFTEYSDSEESDSDMGFDLFGGGCSAPRGQPRRRAAPPSETDSESDTEMGFDLFGGGCSPPRGQPYHGGMSSQLCDAPPSETESESDSEMGFDLFDGGCSAPRDQNFELKAPTDWMGDWATVEETQQEQNTEIFFKSYQEITNAQEPNGEWKCLVKFELVEKIEEKLGDKQENSHTIIALIALLVKFPEKVNEWLLSATKALAVLNFDQDKLEEILESIEVDVDDELIGKLFN